MVACAMTWENPVVSGPEEFTRLPKIQRLVMAALIGLLIQFCLGALIRHTHSGLACPNFPNCLDGFFPIPLTFETVIAFTHRWWGILMLGLFFHLALVTSRFNPSLARPARRVFSLAVGQVFLGIGTVLSGLNTESRAIHAAVGYAIWGVVFYLAVRSGAVRWLWSKAPQRQVA